MNLRGLFFWITLLNLVTGLTTLTEALAEPSTEIHSSEFQSPALDFEKISQRSEPKENYPETEETQPDNSVPAIEQTENDSEDEIIIIIDWQPEPNQQSTPVYIIDAENIQKQGVNSVSEVLQFTPGFAINDVGFGADIHTGTFYRGASINQSVFLLNGRPIGTNINIYHGGTDLNSIPVGAIERIELSSGGSATLYGSEAFGGVVDIITKRGEGLFRGNGLIQFGSHENSNYRGNLGGSTELVDYYFSYEKYDTENRYRVPVGAANRGTDGRLFNGDTKLDSYYGSLVFNIDPRNTLSLDALKTSSRRGLLYFGFPLQQDRLDHDALNVGLSWTTLLGEAEDSVVTTTLSYNQDYFSTYGPTRNVFYRTGITDSQAFNTRIEHDWQTGPNNNLKWGLDLQNAFLTGNTSSNVPDLIQFNEIEDRDRLHTALFALNTWKITPGFLVELGLRQNFNSQFGSYLNPSVGTRWDLTPAIALRGSWLSAHRNPGLDQLYVFDTVHNWLPNPDLEPETGSAWTAGVDVKFSPSLTGQFTYFGNSLRDRLAVQAGRWTNVGLVDTNGLEVALRWQISPEWSTFLNYTYTNAEIKTGLEKGLQLSQIPFSVGQWGMGYDSNGWQVNFFLSYSSGARRAIFTLPGDTPTDFSPPWLRLDLSGRIPITPSLGLLIYLENLTDRTYERVNRTYQPGLTFRLGLQSNF